MKDIKDYLHLYLRCNTDKGKLIGIEMNKAICMLNDLSVVEGNIYSLKPILRRLSSMTEEEADDLLMIAIQHPELSEDKILPDEVHTNVAYDDGGLMMDPDYALVIEFSVRCFEGQLAVRKNGDLQIYSEDRNDSDFSNSAVSNQTQAFVWLLSKSFDLFNLIDEGIAIDRDTLNQETNH